MNALVWFFDDEREVDPFWLGARLGIVQANAIACPIGLLVVAGPWWARLPLILGMAFGWAGWARRDFALRVPASRSALPTKGDSPVGGRLTDDGTTEAAP